ncbi:hypothetical protein P2O73_17300, partial [Escherichia coli]
MRKPEILYKQPILWHFSVFRGNGFSVSGKRLAITTNIMRFGNDSNLLIVFYVQIMPDDFVMQLH